MSLSKEFTDLADDAMEKIGPVLVTLLQGTMRHEDALIAGAAVLLHVRDASGQKYVRAAVDGCTCPGCLDAAMRALCDAYGVNLKEFATEDKPAPNSPITAVH